MASLVDEAQRLAPTIRALAPEIEAGRRIPRDLVDELTVAGLLHGLVPAGLGGRDRSPVEVALAVEVLATADASTAWSTMIGSTTALLAGRIDPGVARLVWGDGRSVAGGTLNPAGRATSSADGGVVLDGRWSWLSGSPHCDWFVLGCIVDGTDVRHCLVPAGDLELHDVWDVVGLCGTASDDGSTTGLFVPGDRVLDLTTQPVTDHPLATVPLITVMAAVLAAVATGTARGALDDLIELAGAKVPYQSRTLLADRSHLQVGVARAEGGLRSARCLLLAELDSLWDLAVSGAEVTVEKRGAVRLASTHAVEASVAAVDAAWLLAGGSVLARSGSIQRRFRDVHAITQHVLVGQPTWQMAGRALLGRLEDSPFTL